jgi:hypothetical protein
MISTPGPLDAHTAHLPVPPPAGSAARQTIMIIRHAEKPADDGRPHGVTPGGKRDKHSLTVAGWARAGALVGLFGPARGPLPEGLCRPDALYASASGDGQGQRPEQTVLPLAARLDQPIVTRYTKGDEKALAGELVERPGATLVCWQHESIPDIVRHLGQVRPQPPGEWPDQRYDVVWVFTPADSGWHFHQVPQLLLAGDRAQPI